MSNVSTNSIVATSLYTLNSARALMGWTSKPAWLAARNRGLKSRIKYIGSRGYLTGQDLIDFVTESGNKRYAEDATPEEVTA